MVFNKQFISAPIEVIGERTVDIYANNDKPFFSNFEKCSSVIIPRNYNLLWIRGIRNTGIKLDSLFSLSIRICVAQDQKKIQVFLLHIALQNEV